MLSLLLVCSLNVIYTAGIGGEFMGCGCAGQEGGIARIATYIKNTPHEILLDAGGIFGKNRFVDSLALLHLKDYNYDAVAVSPNELKFGPEFIAHMSRISPLLCSNIRYHGEPIAREFLMKECNGVKVLMTAIIDTDVNIAQEGIEVLEPAEVLARFRSLPEAEDYDVHISILNGRERRLVIEDLGSVGADWIRRIGLIKVFGKEFENTTAILDSTIPEDESTMQKVAAVLNYLHNLPAREVVSDFPARTVLNYYYADEGDTFMKEHFLLLARMYMGMLSVRYILHGAPPYITIGGDRIEIGQETGRELHEKIAAMIEDGGDDHVQVVYFPDPGCPECQRYSLLLRAYAADNPVISISEVEDEVLLQRFCEAYKIPEEKCQKPAIFIGSRCLLKDDISSGNLFLEGKIPWLDIYGIK